MYSLHCIIKNTLVFTLVLCGNIYLLEYLNIVSLYQKSVTQSPSHTNHLNAQLQNTLHTILSTYCLAWENDNKNLCKILDKINKIFTVVVI